MPPRRLRKAPSPAPTTESHPAHPVNLTRSLARNDIEICALAKLNSALRLLREEICREYGEETLIEIATRNPKAAKQEGVDVIKDETDDTVKQEDDTKDERLEQLSTAFTLRMKLRRRLLNRLARRLYRVAYIMDNGDASPPLPPLYGDEVVRFKEDDDYCRFVPEEEVTKFVEDQEKRRELKEEVAKKRRERVAELEKLQDDEPNEQTAVDFLLRGDAEDKALLSQLKEYEVGYDRAIVKEGDQPSEINPIVNTVDTHEVSEDGEFVNKESDVQRVNFTLFGVDKRPIPPRDRSVDWKRWNKEMSTKIEEQVTFEDIGMEGKVFDLEKRLENAKRKREESSLRGKGKVLRRKSAFDSSVGDTENVKKEESESEKKEGNGMNVDDNNDDGDGVVKMEADEVKSEKDISPSESTTDAEKPSEEEKAEVKEAQLVEVKAPKRHNRVFSLRPVPSFYDQDLRRVKLVQIELIHSSGTIHIEKYAKKAQAVYEEAFKKSMELQQAKAAAIGDYQKAVQQHKIHIQGMKVSAEKKMNKAKSDWQQMQNMMHNYRNNYGEQRLQLKLACSDAIKDIIDRVVMRASTDETAQGTKLTRHAAREAHSSQNDSKLAVANTLGWIVDSVDRRHANIAERNSSFIPPIVETEHNTIYDAHKKETIADRFAFVESQLKKRVQQISVSFSAAEKTRADAWNDVVKYKNMIDSSGGGSKIKRGRKSNTGGRSVVTAVAPRPAYQQQPQRQQHQFMPVGRPIQMMRSAPMPVQHSQQVMPAQMMAGAMAGQQGAAFNRVAVQPSNAATMPVQQQNHPGGDMRTSQNTKYGYGDRYSTQNVQARHQNDGSVVPVTQPKLLPNGEYQRPIGRQRKGMEWDSIRGVWIPNGDRSSMEE